MSWIFYYLLVPYVVLGTIIYSLVGRRSLLFYLLTLLLYVPILLIFGTLIILTYIYYAIKRSKR